MAVANERRPITDEELKEIRLQMAEAETGGMLNEMFKADIQLHEGPDRRTLLDSFKVDMKLFKSTFSKIFGYDMTTPGFADDALARLEILGCSRARNYYTCITAEWQHEHDKMMKEVAHWYRGQSFEGKKVSEPRRQQEAEQRNLTKSELIELCRKLLQEGVIESPEQFAMAVTPVL